MEHWPEIGSTKRSTLLGIVLKIISAVLDAAEKVSLTAAWDRNDYLKERGDSSTFKEVEVTEKRECFLASRGVGLSLDI